MSAVEIVLWAMVATRLIGTGAGIVSTDNKYEAVGGVIGQAVVIGVLVWAAVSLP